MDRIIRRVLWATALFLLVSCATGKEKATSTPSPRPKPSPPRSPSSTSRPVLPYVKIEVTYLQLTENREYVRMKIRIRERDLDALNPAEIYLVNEATGERHPVVQLQRTGKLAEFGIPDEEGIRHIMFRNREGGLKAGSRVTVVVGKPIKGRMLLQ